MGSVVKVGIIGPKPCFIGGHDLDNEIRSYIYKQLDTILLSYLEQKMVVIGITGLELGIAQDFAHVCIDRNISYIAYLPYESQESQWKGLSSDITESYQKLLKSADKIVKVSEGGFSPRKIIRKNHKIICDVDHLILVIREGEKSEYLGKCSTIVIKI